MAHPTIGRAFIAVLSRLPVNAVGIGASLVLMTGCALRFGDIGGVRIGLVALVAGVAGQAGMGALFELLTLLMAGDTLDWFAGGTEGPGSRRSKQKAKEGSSERRVRKCPARHGPRLPD